MKLLELQTILDQISKKKCTHTAKLWIWYIKKSIMLKMYPKKAGYIPVICYICSRRLPSLLVFIIQV